MLRIIRIAAALRVPSRICAGVDRRTEQCLHGRLPEILQGRHAGRRTDHRLPVQGKRQVDRGLQEGAGGRGKEITSPQLAVAKRGSEIHERSAGIARQAFLELRRTFTCNLNINQANSRETKMRSFLLIAAAVLSFAATMTCRLRRLPRCGRVALRGGNRLFGKDRSGRNFFSGAAARRRLVCLPDCKYTVDLGG